MAPWPDSCTRLASVENDDSWIPESFKEGMADAEAGRVVDLDTALNEPYPGDKRSIGFKTLAHSGGVSESCRSDNRPKLARRLLIFKQNPFDRRYVPTRSTGYRLVTDVS